MLKKTILLALLVAVTLSVGDCSNTDSTEPILSRTEWDILIAEDIEAIPLIYPDTQAAYLYKAVPSSPDVAYRVEFTLPYATYSSTTIYQDTKPISALRDAQYILSTGDSNPYQPGNRIMTSRDQREVVLFVTPDFDSAVAQGVDNPIAMGPPGGDNLIFQRVYYANRKSPEESRRFFSSLDFDRWGYTLPRLIHCVDPQRLGTLVRCPIFNPFSEITALNFNIGRSPPPAPPGSCPNRLRWDRPQLAAVHWAGPGGLDNTGKNPPDVQTSCTGYLLTMVFEPVNMIVMTRIQTPPTFFDVSTLDDTTTLPDPAPDTRYIGIQNYGTTGSDVRYNQQSRSVGEIITYPDNLGQGKGEEWIFLHYVRPIASSDQDTIIAWAAGQNINQQQMAIFKKFDMHPPFMIYRNKETSEAFKQSQGFVRNSVPCFSAADGKYEDSPISNAADGTNLGTFVPITITCEITDPGNLTGQDLDDCFKTLMDTDPDWDSCA